MLLIQLHVKLACVAARLPGQGLCIVSGRRARGGSRRRQRPHRRSISVAAPGEESVDRRPVQRLRSPRHVHHRTRHSDARAGPAKALAL